MSTTTPYSVLGYYTNMPAENVQILVASLLFILVGQFGARFYEKSSFEGAYTRGSFFRLMQYMLGVAPMVYILLLKNLFGWAGESGKILYLIYSVMGLVGFLACVMLLTDINKSKFTADEVASGSNATLAKAFGIIGALVFGVHFLACAGLAFKVGDNKDLKPFSLATFNSLTGKSTAAPVTAPSNAFGMDDLLSFGKRRKRY